MKKKIKQYSRFYYSFLITTTLFIYTYWELVLSNIFQYFNLNTEEQFSWIGIHIGIFMLTILGIYEYYEKKYLDMKFAMLFKDLSIQNNISYKDLLTKFPDYHKRDALQEHKFEEYEIISYINYKAIKRIKFENIEMSTEEPGKIFKIKCLRETNGTNHIFINLLNNNDGLYLKGYFPLKLDNYDSIEKLIDFYYKSLEFYQKNE